MIFIYFRTLISKRQYILSKHVLLYIIIIILTNISFSLEMPKFLTLAREVIRKFINFIADEFIKKKVSLFIYYYSAIHIISYCIFMPSTQE